MPTTEKRSKKRERKREREQKKPFDYFYAVGVGSTKSQTPETQFVHDLINRVIKSYSSMVSTSKNFSATELIYTCDLRIAYAHRRVQFTPNEFLMRAAFVGGSVHQMFESIIAKNSKTTENGVLVLNGNLIHIEKTFRYNLFNQKTTDENDEEGMVIKPDLLISNDGGGSWVLVDFKIQFSNHLNVKFEHRRQMLIYVAILRMMGYNVKSVVLMYFPLRFGNLKIIPIEMRFSDYEIQKIIEEIKIRILNVNMAMKNEEIMPLKHFGDWCTTCPFKKYCMSDIHPLKLPVVKPISKMNDEWVGETSTV